MIYETTQDFPVDIGQTDVTLRAVNVVGVQEGPFSLKRETQVFPGARWEMEIAFLPTVREEAQRLEAWLLSLRGRAGTFRLADPYRSIPLGVHVSPGQVGPTAATAGSEEIPTDSWDPDTPDVLKAGDFLEIGQRLHMVLEDVSSDVAGAATIKVWPPLRETYADGTTITYQNARGVFSLDSNAVEFTRGVNGLNGAMLRAVEVV